MVEFEYAKIKKVVVHELYKYETKEKLIQRVLRSNGPSHLFWCNGILFYFFPSDTDGAKVDYMKGIFHWEVLVYAAMNRYESIVEYEDEMIKGVRIRVVDYGHFEIFSDLAKWLQTQKPD